MAALTIMHRGVPIGSTETTPRPDVDAPDWFEFALLDFTPLPAFESVAPVVRLASHRERWPTSASSDPQQIRV